MRHELDPSWWLLCANAILPQLEALSREARGVMAQEDVENVHRMRVASRRIRAALDIFEECFPPKAFKAWRKEVRGVTRALGEARDVDVQIEFLRDHLAMLPASGSPGVELALAIKRERRQDLQAELLEALRSLKDRGTISAMEERILQGRKEALAAGVREVRTPFAFASAAREVRGRVEGLVELEPFVHQEAAVAEHHAMRIAGKRLRYTLEVFRPLFDDGLKDELATMKRLQDLLGELHDCDVWATDLGSMLRDLGGGKLDAVKGTPPRKIGPGLRLLLEDRQRRRRQVYHELESFWDEMSERGFLDSLLRRVESAAGDVPDLTSKAIGALIADPGATVAVLGDVHGNARALRAVLEDAEGRGAKVLINTGDLLGYGAEPEEVVGIVRSRPSINVIGNYDLKVFRVHEREVGKEGTGNKLNALDWAYEHISPSSREWLLSLPRELRLDIGGRRLLIVHGSPDSMDERIGPDTPEARLEEIAASAKADLIIFGHSHQALSRKATGTRFLNPGSVGRQDDGDPRASYALLRLKPFRATVRRVGYDVEAAAEGVRREGLPEAFAQMILQGRSYEWVSGERMQDRPSDRQESLQRSREVSRSYLGEDAHTEQVVRLATYLFECLRVELGLDDEDRSLLICSALLHDVGWVEGRKGHHKASLRIILEEEGLPFDPRERAIVGLVARYHRKALPSKRHAHYSTLGREDRRRVTKLSAILRTADALDCTHGGKVRSLRCELAPDRIIIHCIAIGDLEMEERDALRKGDLIRKVLGRDLEILRDVE